MIYLGLAIVCSASIALIFKHSETADRNRNIITSANYLAATTVAGSMFVVQGLPRSEPWRLTVAVSELGRTLASGPITPDGSILWAWIVGLSAGAFFFLSFLYYQIAIRRHGMSLSGAFLKMGTLVPLLLSLIFWQEMPEPLQWAGIALALVSMAVVNWPDRGQWQQAFRPALVLVCIFGGVAEFSNKIFQNYGLSEHKNLFLTVTFATAFLCSLTVSIRDRRSLNLADIGIGLLVGIPNLFASFFLILALGELPAAVAFPLFGAGTILIIHFVGVAFFKEVLSRTEYLAIFLTILALVLINL